MDKITREDKAKYFINKNKTGVHLLERDKKRARVFSLFKKLVTALHAEYIDRVLSENDNTESLSDDFASLINKLVDYKNKKSRESDDLSDIEKNVNKLKKELASSINKVLKNKNNAIEIAIGERNITIDFNALTGAGDPGADKLVEAFREIPIEDLKKAEIFKHYIDEQDWDLEDISWGKEADALNPFSFFHKWKTYLRKFYQIRAKIYDTDGYDSDTENSGIVKGLAHQITTRILDDNAELFVQNYQKYLSQIAEKDYKAKLDEQLSKELSVNSDIFKPENFANVLSQSQIDIYNKAVGIANRFLNEKLQGSGKKPDFFKKLYKQILGKENKDENSDSKDEFLEFDTIDELQKFLLVANDYDGKPFLQYAVDLLDKDIFTGLLDKENKKLNFPETELGEFRLNTNQLSFISNFAFGNWEVFRDAVKRVKEELKNKKDDELTGEEKQVIDSVNKFLDENEIALSELVQIFRFKVEDPDSSEKTKINLTGKDLYKLVKEESAWNLPKEELQKFSQEDTGDAALYNLLLVFELYFNSLRNGRAWHTAVEEKEMEESCDKKTCPEHKSLRELFEDLKSYVSAHGEQIKESKNKRNDYMEKLSILFYRLNDMNKFLYLFELADDESLYTNKALQEIVKINPRKNKINEAFNATRNYATKAIVVEDKIKLTFERQKLADGWSLKKTENRWGNQYEAFILKKNDKYHLGINAKLPFRIENNFNLDGFEIMEYKLLKNKTLFGSSWRGYFNESSPNYTLERLRKENPDTAVKKINKMLAEFLNEKFVKTNYFSAITDKFKEIVALLESGKVDFELSYEKLSSLYAKKFSTEYKDDDSDKSTKLDRMEELSKYLVDEQILNTIPLHCIVNKIKSILDKKEGVLSGNEVAMCYIATLEKYMYEIEFINVNKKNPPTNLVLFEIYNKDFSDKKEADSTKNIHTLYFLELFSAENKKNSQFKLSGQAEVFFRDALPESEREKVSKAELKKPKTDKIPYRKKRFASPKILFHVPIEINRLAGKGGVADEIKEYIKNNKDEISVIGVDRGEKHLAYYCLLDKDGNIKEIDSLNEIEGIKFQEKLTAREEQRMKNRKLWKTIEQIKDLKKGYISFVIRKLAEMIVDNNTILTMEELNRGFKRGRMKIEKNIYQQLENALLHKLEYFVKEKTSGGIRNAYQLVPPVGPQYKWGSQQGVVFYVDAKFTSKTCPKCGYRRRGVNFGSSKDIRKMMDKKDLQLFYDKENDRFIVKYKWEYKYKNPSGNEIPFRSDYLLTDSNGFETIYSNIDRSVWRKKQHNVERINVTKILKEALLDVDLDDLAINKNIFEIPDIEVSFSKLKMALKYWTNLRFEDNWSDIEDDKRDVLQCPSCHFDTRKANHLINGDAVGAYNIARKGILAKQNLAEKNKAKVILKEWDEYTHQQRSEQRDL